MSDLLNLNSANGKSRPRTILRVTHRVGRAAFAALLFCSLLVATPAGGRGAQPGLELTPPHVPVPPSYFGMNILFHPLNMKYVPWPSVPLGGWRTSHVAWSDLEPERGRWNWDLLDKYVSMSQQHHLEILMPLAYTPRWASSTPDAATDVQQGNPPGLSGMPREMEDWRTFVRTIATRYKGRIRNWEIWNEPNRPQSWTGTVDQMVDLTREAAAILKQIDPGSTVVSPAATTPYGLKFFEAFLSICDWTQVYYLWRPNLRDEGDNHLIELAVAGAAAMIVTNNVRDFRGSELRFTSIKIVEPGHLRKELK